MNGYEMARDNHGIAVGLIAAVTLSIGAARAAAQSWPPTEGMAIEPALPTSADEVTVTLSGDWPNSCVPNASAISRQGNEIDFDVILDYPVEVLCAQAFTPWERDEVIGPLPAETYTVYATLFDDAMQPQTDRTLIATFAVEDGEDGGTCTCGTFLCPAAGVGILALALAGLVRTTGGGARATRSVRSDP